MWFASRASLQPLSRTTLQRLAARADVLGHPCLVVSDPPGSGPSPGQETHPATDPVLSPLSVEDLPPAVRLPIQLRRYDDRCLEFDATAPGDGWLLVTDRWAPGWRAWVNDRRRPVWIGNLAFRAVPVERGENHVRFCYEPLGHPWLLLCSWLVLGLVCAGSAWATLGRKRLAYFPLAGPGGVSSVQNS